jgi:hypothetical protein
VSPRHNRPHKQERAARARNARDGRDTRGDDEDGGDPFARFGRTEQWQGEDWTVRPIAGAASTKHYRCPGCDQEIPPGTAHVVAWREYAGVDDRRHWHRPCWNAKDRRTTRVQRSRNAPRY